MDRVLNLNQTPNLDSLQGGAGGACWALHWPTPPCSVHPVHGTLSLPPRPSLRCTDRSTQRLTPFLPNRLAPQPATAGPAGLCCCPTPFPLKGLSVCLTTLLPSSTRLSLARLDCSPLLALLVRSRATPSATAVAQSPSELHSKLPPIHLLSPNLAGYTRPVILYSNHGSLTTLAISTGCANHATEVAASCTPMAGT